MPAAEPPDGTGPDQRPARTRSREAAPAASWGFAATLAAITATACLVRAPGLVREGLSSDEAVYLGQGIALTHGGEWQSVRAHPPLLGLTLELLPGGAANELVGRGFSLALGLLAIVVAGLMGRELAGRAAGVLAAGALAWMPYHGDVTRLALVDVPMATLVALALLLVTRADRTGRQGLVEVAAVLLGAATLFKETALLSVAAVVVASAYGDPRLPRRTAVRSIVWYVVVVGSYPIFLLLRRSTGTGVDYLTWQLGRTGREPASFYLDTVAPRVGFMILVIAVGGAVVLLARRQQGILLLSLSVALPLTFYLLWPVRGYPYLLASAAPVAALAGSGAAVLGRSLMRRRRLVIPVLAVVVLLGGAGASAESAAPPRIPGASGVPGTREAATWIAEQKPSPVVTSAPWIANVLRYYLNGWSVATLRTTAVDPPVTNPAYRTGGVTRLPPGRTLVVWDVWSAHTDPNGSARLLSLVRERDGRVAHVETAAPGTGPTILVVVFEVDP